MTVAVRRGDSIGRFVAGDPLRAMAATLVVAFHAFIVIGREYPGFTAAYGDVADPLIQHSASVIFMFFALSGYLLGRPYVRAFVLGRANPRLGNFARNRVARIVPACWAAVTLTFLIRGVGDSSPLEVAAVYGLVQTLVPSDAREYVLHVWSVDVEAAFYVLLPILGGVAAWLFRGRGDQRTRLYAVLAFLAAAALLSLLWRARHPTDLYWQRQMPAIFFAIAVGMALGALEIPGVAWARRLRSARRLGDAAFVAGWIVLLGAPTAGVAGAPQRTAVVIVACSLIMGGPLLRQWAGRGCSRLLDNRPMHAIGRWSYSIYLFHLVILHEASALADGSSIWRDAAVVLPLVILGSYALGALSFQLIEKPCMRFRGISSQPTAAPTESPINLESGSEARGQPLPGVPDPVAPPVRTNPEVR